MPEAPPHAGEPRDKRRIDLLSRRFDFNQLVSLRRDVARCAEDNGLAHPDLYRFIVAVNEITTNAVRHGGGDGHLELWRTGNTLHCRIVDHGPGLPANVLAGTRPPSHLVSGRGLWLARHCCELTAESDPTGTTVTLVSPINVARLS
jgi:anti-sigma regulatory factor (Ser/Thr protein kinase)